MMPLGGSNLRVRLARVRAKSIHQFHLIRLTMPALFPARFLASAIASLACSAKAAWVKSIAPMI